MFNAFVKVASEVDDLGNIAGLLKELKGKQVYVGIPEGADNERPAEGATGVTNSELMYMHTNGVRQTSMRNEMDKTKGSYGKAFSLYIHTYGSPLWHSPPRPVIEPAIENSKVEIAKQLKKALSAALDGKDPMIELQKAGMMGQNVCREWFTNPANGWAPNSPATIAKKGSDMPLIDEGEMRKAITYVVTDGK